MQSRCNTRPLTCCRRRVGMRMGRRSWAATITRSDRCRRPFRCCANPNKTKRPLVYTGQHGWRARRSASAWVLPELSAQQILRPALARPARSGTQQRGNACRLASQRCCCAPLWRLPGPRKPVSRPAPYHHAVDSIRSTPECWLCEQLPLPPCCTLNRPSGGKSSLRAHQGGQGSAAEGSGVLAARQAMQARAPV